MLESTKPEALALVRTAFPDLKVRSVGVSAGETIQFYGTAWDSGYKRDYAIVTIKTGHVTHIPDAPFLKRDPMYEKQHPLIPGIAIVTHVHSGLREYARIVCHPDDLEKFAPESEEVSQDEKIVLYATRSLKSSYGGISNYRFHEASSATGITEDRWERAKATLIDRKLLNKRGAITPDGRNCIADVCSFWQIQQPQ